MVLYYSGTGNSKYVAQRISDTIQDECIDLFDKLRNSDFREINSAKPFVIVTPTYGWQIPHILRDWINKTRLSGNKSIYFVMTCGGDISNAPKYLKKICQNKNMNFMGCAEIIMPENYIALFDVPDKNEAIAIIDKAEPIIDKTAALILENKYIDSTPVGILGKLKSSIVNTVYYPVFLHAKKFEVSDACISCGKCADLCVMNNIKLVNGKPEWTDNCTHCMACICSCPVEAIEYGSKSKGKPRYNCPK